MVFKAIMEALMNLKHINKAIIKHWILVNPFPLWDHH
jgi:hypothetical protein